MDTEVLIEDVREAADVVDAALEAVEEARRALHRAALRALVAVDGDDERERQLVRTLYWDVPAVPVKTMEAVIGSAKQVRDLAAPGPLLGRCDGCEAEVFATSRTHRDTGPVRCKPCERKHRPAAIRPPHPWPPDPWHEDAPPPEPPDWDELDDAEDDAWPAGPAPWAGAPGW